MWFVFSVCPRRGIITIHRVILRQSHVRHLVRSPTLGKFCTSDVLLTLVRQPPTHFISTYKSALHQRHDEDGRFCRWRRTIMARPNDGVADWHLRAVWRLGHAQRQGRVARVPRTQRRSGTCQGIVRQSHRRPHGW